MVRHMKRALAACLATVLAAYPAFAQQAELGKGPVLGISALPEQTGVTYSGNVTKSVPVNIPISTPAPAVKVAANSCELHVWPAERMASMTTGLLGGGLLDAAIHANRDASNRALLASALDSTSQVEALKAMDLLALLARKPGTAVILHDKPLDRPTMNKVKTRRAGSASPCYSELIVADVFYQKAAIYGRSLKTLFMFRDFGPDQTIDFEYKSWGGNGLKLFPPNEGEDSIAALDELVSVFRLNFQEYANNQRKALEFKSKS